MDDDVCRQLLQGSQMVAERLLDQVALLHAGRAHVLLEQFLGCSRDDR